MLVRSISKELNELFEGGLHKGIVTQLYGEAGCGKTQVAMMFVLEVLIRRYRPFRGICRPATYRLRRS